jgi:hypothetical protein
MIKKPGDIILENAQNMYQGNDSEIKTACLIAGVCAMFDALAAALGLEFDEDKGFLKVQKEKKPKKFKTMRASTSTKKTK